LDLEVINNLAYPIEILPQQISYYASSRPFPVLDDQDNIHSKSAPHSDLTVGRQLCTSPDAMTTLYREKAQSKAVFASLMAIAVVSIVVYDAVKDGSDYSKEIFTKRDANRSFGRDLVVSAAITASDVAKLSSHQAKEDDYYLRYEIFPETQILPGNGRRGKVFLPFETYHRYYRVVVPVGASDYVFDFKRADQVNKH
jgi:hypothetical protein